MFLFYSRTFTVVGIKVEVFAWSIIGCFLNTESAEMSILSPVLFSEHISFWSADISLVDSDFAVLPTKSWL